MDVYRQSGPSRDPSVIKLIIIHDALWAVRAGARRGRDSEPIIHYARQLYVVISRYPTTLN